VTTERASIFGADDEFDISGFMPEKPKADTPADRVRRVSEASEFRSREPDTRAAAAEPRRYRTGRNIHLNLKVRQEARERFYRVADAYEWVLGETFEKALDALERELGPREGSR